MRDNYRRGFLSDQAEPDDPKAKGAEDDEVEALDKVKEEIEFDHRGYRGRLGSLTRQPNDGPSPLMERAEISDKLAKSWIAMQRARSGTLMKGVIENIDAERVLRRARRLFDIAAREYHALPSLYVTGKDGRGLYSDDKAVGRFDYTVVELNGENSERQEVPFQMDFRHRFGPPYAPRERKLASMTEGEYKRARRRMRNLHEEHRTVPRGPDEQRSPREWHRSSLRLAGKTKCKGGPPPFNPHHDTTEQHDSLSAVVELELLWSFMRKNDYRVLTALLENGVNIADVGGEAGFKGKQAEAVGLDRSRTAIQATIAAFEIIDAMEASDSLGWLYRVSPDALLPVWLVKRLLQANKG